ncbi:MAG: nitroreductase family protein [Lachnospiraceae bacterium]|nr:nitroreductase family protein [Lachnospiraceae bacterium]
MNTIDTIKARRSVRKYKTDPVPEELLKDLLEAAAWAPSAVNRQPWYFVAISKPEQLHLLGQIMEEVSLKVEPNLQKTFQNHPEVVSETTAFIRRLGGAPACVLAFMQHDNYAPEVADAMTLSVGAAIENMLLRATELGLGSCWMTAPVEVSCGDRIRDLFAPEKGRLVSMIVLGYPAQEPQAPRRKEERYVIL